MVVDGDPAAREGADVCFPEALFEGVDGAVAEPLAADVRKWADGRQLTRLKLVAGLLSVRLDELRQRDLQRRRKRQAMISIAAIAAAALVVLTIASWISERTEREKAEQMATFVVDLGERLHSDVDLETLAIINAQASTYLEGLDQRRLSPETRVKVALAIRQLGYVSELQGRPEEAIAAYERSRGLFRDLNGKHPQDQQILFELAQVEWYVGHFYFQRGEYARVLEPMKAYETAARELIRLDPDNPEWRMELSYALTSLAALYIEESPATDARTLKTLNEAVETIELAMVQLPHDDEVLGEYANTLAWVADAKLRACELNDAMNARQKTLEIATQAMNADPSNNGLKLTVAYGYSGVAGIHSELGQVDRAADNLRSSLAILEELSAADPSNVILQYDVAIRQFRLSRLLDANLSGREKLAQLQKMEFNLSLDHEGNLNPGALPVDYLDWLSAQAEAQNQAGLDVETHQSLRQAMDFAVSPSIAKPLSPAEQEELSIIRFQWWEMLGQDPVDEYPLLDEFTVSAQSEFRSCGAVAVDARLAILKGDLDSARTHAQYLEERGYRDPAYVRFCRRHGICTE
jgi:tetratricopeptide (TPR) repeat protein